MKRIILVTMAILIFFDMVALPVSANNDYDYDELMQYEGFGKSMYDSVVEQTTFITGQYTDNKDYVSNTIQQVKDYADFWYNEYNDFTSSCYQTSAMNCLGEMTERGGAYLLTVGDWIKNLFTGYSNEVMPPIEEENLFDEYITYVSNQYYKVNPGYELVVLSASGSEYKFNNSHGGVSGIRFNAGGSYGGVVDPNNEQLKGTVSFTVSGIDMSPQKTLYGAEAYRIYTFNANGNFANIISLASEFGVSMSFRRVDTGENVNPRPPSNIPERNFIDYIINNTPQVVVPQLKPKLVCPNGTTIQMSIDGSTFVAVDGSVMLVNKDGTAEVNGEICNLGWEKPIVQYNPDTGQPEVIQPDGTKTDLETGGTEKPPIDVPSHTDLKDCDGIMCGIGKVLDGLGGVVGALGDFVLDLLKGLKDLLIELFVPDADFFAPLLTQMRTLAVDKLKMDEMKKLFDGLSGGGGASVANLETVPMQNVAVMSARSGGDMFAINPDDIVNTSFIDEMLPTVHSWVRGFFYPLLIYFNINQLYKMIRGTSLLGGRGKDD